MVIGEKLDGCVRTLIDAQDNRREVDRIDPEGALTEEKAYALLAGAQADAIVVSPGDNAAPSSRSQAALSVSFA